MTRKERVILTDCDGCLVDWNDGFDKFMNSKGLTQLPDSDQFYALSERYDISFNQANEYVIEFNNSNFIGNLEPFADSVEYVGKLADLGFRFTVVTSLSDQVDAMMYREANLHGIFGDAFDEIICLKMGSSKYHTLKRWAGSEYFWIEDHMRQAEAGFEQGLCPILINHPYNQHYGTDLFPRVTFATPWAEIYEMVKEDYNI